MLKKLFRICLIILLLLVFPKPADAQSEFIVDVNVDYDVQQNGTTQVTHTTVLENAFSNLYATSYILNLENIDPQNARAYQGSKALVLSETKQGNTVTLKVEFDEAVVGKGKSQTFNISFEEQGFATKTGEVWEISIPRISQEDSFRSYNVNLLVPTSFGNEAYISPDPKVKEKIGTKLIYRFDKEMVAKTGITVGFGQFQIFSFTLKYHLENPLARSAMTEIAIPPDTAFQKLYYQEIKPKPDNVFVDGDGNWLAQYSLKARERVDIVATGTVQIFASPKSFPSPSEDILEQNLKTTEYWQVEDEEIQELAGRLATPKSIYNFVTNNLNYNYDRVRPNVTRYGAKKALANPNEAICMEFTDLFIALTRAAGIPAREVNGYAYTENPEIQPLSLVADVLHSWPEYYDFEKNVWIPIDPTWGSTTGGVDFFEKLDLRHFTFVIHGQNANQPYPPGSYKLGPNPEKDVFVNFGQLPSERESKPEIIAEVKNVFPLTGSKVSIKIKNPGPIALYDLAPTVYFDNQKVSSSFVSILPPYGISEMKTSIPFSFLGTKTPNQVVIVAGNSSLNLPSNKNQVIIYNLLILFLLFATLVIVIILRLKKINLIEKAKSFLKRLRLKKEPTNPVS